MTQPYNEEFTHNRFSIETREVCTYDGMPIDDMPHKQVVKLCKQLLRDLKKTKEGETALREVGKT